MLPLARRAASFDHFVGAGQDRRRDRQPERRGGLPIDDELEFAGLFDGQIRRPNAL